MTEFVIPVLWTSMKETWEKFTGTSADFYRKIFPTHYYVDGQIKPHTLSFWDWNVCVCVCVLCFINMKLLTDVATLVRARQSPSRDSPVTRKYTLYHFNKVVPQNHPLLEATFKLSGKAVGCGRSQL